MASHTLCCEVKSHVRCEDETVPVGTLVCVTGEDFFATVAGRLGIVIAHRAARMGDLNVVLVGDRHIVARTDQLTLVAESGE